MKTLKSITFLIFIFAVITLGMSAVFQNELPRNRKDTSILIYSNNENDISFIEEHEVINMVFDSILNVGYCHPIIKVSKNAELEYINAVRKRMFISETERDTIQKFGIVDTKSRIQDDLKYHKELLHKELNGLISDSSFFHKMEFILNKRNLDSELIKKKGIELLTEETAEERGLNPKRFGKRNSLLNIGFVNFSRVYYSKKNNLGIFCYRYLGSPDCGYDGYVVFTKQNSNWTFKKMIYAGVY